MSLRGKRRYLHMQPGQLILCMRVGIPGPPVDWLSRRLQPQPCASLERMPDEEMASQRAAWLLHKGEEANDAVPMRKGYLELQELGDACMHVATPYDGTLD